MYRTSFLLTIPPRKFLLEYVPYKGQNVWYVLKVPYIFFLFIFSILFIWFDAEDVPHKWEPARGTNEPFFSSPNDVSKMDIYKKKTWRQDFSRFWKKSLYRLDVSYPGPPSNSHTTSLKLPPHKFLFEYTFKISKMCHHLKVPYPFPHSIVSQLTPHHSTTQYFLSFSLFSHEFLKNTFLQREKCFLFWELILSATVHILTPLYSTPPVIKQFETLECKYTYSQDKKRWKHDFFL